ncbi:MAG: hypothetical protein JSU87_01500 [Gemmatimonadota bacterium]|nr:MAG: hypothetical protein JSU87_01500 [Gemmatimonadota bacterium]
MISSRIPLALAVLFGLIVPQSACTLVGFGIGSVIDSGNKRTIRPESFAPDTIDLGKTFKLRLRDGSVVGGKYLGIEPLPDEEYAARYAVAREQRLMNVPLPEIGETVTLRMNRGDELDAEFLGFDFNSVLVRKPGEFGPESLRLGDIRQFRVAGNEAIRGEALTLLLSEGALPLQSALVVQAKPAKGREGGRRLLPMDEVLLIEWKPGAGRTVGAIIGATIDVAILVAVGACAATACLAPY